MYAKSSTRTLNPRFLSQTAPYDVEYSNGIWAALAAGGDLGAFGPGKMQKQFEAGAYTRPLFGST